MLSSSSALSAWHCSSAIHPRCSEVPVGASTEAPSVDIVEFPLVGAHPSPAEVPVEQSTEAPAALDQDEQEVMAVYDRAMGNDDIPPTQSVFHPQPLSTPNEFPLSCNTKVFPLTKNGSKQINLGIDAKDFSPFALLIADSKPNVNRVWLRISTAELLVLSSNEIFSRIMNIVDRRSPPEPLKVGDLTLDVCFNKNNNFLTTVCISKEKSPIKFYLAVSSWKLFHNLYENLEYSLLSLSELGNLAKLNFPYLISHCADYCVKNNYLAPQAIVQLSKNQCETLLTNAMRCFIFNFPVSTKLDLMSFHLDFVKEHIFSLMRQ